MKTTLAEEEVRAIVSSHLENELNVTADPAEMDWELNTHNHGEDYFVGGLTVNMKKKDGGD